MEAESRQHEIAESRQDRAAFDFVRDSATPEKFDGWWQVWRATVCIGYVRKSDDPVYPGRPWGYKTKGAICEAGFRTRQDAAEGLLRRFIRA